jgi:hypothetical protein
MSWHFYSTNSSSSEEQNQEYSEEASNTMARITDNTSEYLTALDFSFAGREPFTSDPTFDFLLQRFRSDTTTSWDQLEINIPPNLHKFTEEINRDTHQIYNHHSDSKVQSENKDR